jgi:glycosyltransferase involved in cell wall biosynthesis
MKVSVIMWCWTRQNHLDETLPLWLAQKEADFEIVLAIGPTIKVPDDKRIITIPITECKGCYAFNQAIKSATGQLLLFSYVDMQVNNPLQIKNMLDNYKDNSIVTDSVFRNGHRFPGVYLDCTMVSKEAVIKVGGLCEEFDTGETFGHEDGDFIALLLEQGLSFEFMKTDPELAIYHISHESPDMNNDPVVQKRFANGKNLYFSRHKEGIMALFAKQLTSRFMKRRIT